MVCRKYCQTSAAIHSCYKAIEARDERVYSNGVILGKCANRHILSSKGQGTCLHTDAVGSVVELKGPRVFPESA